MNHSFCLQSIFQTIFLSSNNIFLYFITELKLLNVILCYLIKGYNEKTQYILKTNVILYKHYQMLNTRQSRNE